MTSLAIIEEIRQLPPDGQVEIIQFAVQLAQERPLTARELTTLTERMVASDDPAEVEKLKTAITRGFYGETAHA